MDASPYRSLYYTGTSIVSLIAVLCVFLAVKNIFTPRPVSPAVFQKAADAFNANDFESALLAVNATLASNPNNVEALLAKANILAQEGSIEFKEKEFGTQAIALATQALVLNPQSDEAYRIIGYANEIMQNFPAAYDAYAKALAINPRNAFVISQQAHAQYLQGDIAKAEMGYRVALAIDPTLGQASIGLAQILVEQGNIAGALPLFVTASKSAANIRERSEAAYSAGELYIQLNNPLQAKQFMTTATSLDSTYPLGWVGLGLIDFNMAIATTSSLTHAERNAAVLLSMQLLQKAIALNQYQSAAYYQLGIELGTVGDRALSTKFLTEANTIVPQDITLNTTQKQIMQARIKSALAI